VRHFRRRLSSTRTPRITEEVQSGKTKLICSLTYTNYKYAYYYAHAVQTLVYGKNAVANYIKLGLSQSIILLSSAKLCYLLIYLYVYKPLFTDNGSAWRIEKSHYRHNR
jgi:hypothetical protein